MSLLHGNFKQQLKRIAIPECPERQDKETCPKAEVPRDFFEKKYAPEDFNPPADFCKNLEEDERFDFLLRMKHNMTEYFDNTAYTNPYGMTNYDYKSIAESQKECLEKIKMKARRENYIYLNNHPEVDAMIELLLRKMFLDQPEDPVKYCAEFFCVKQSSYDEHKKGIEEEREKIIRYRKAKSKEFYVPISDPSTTIRKLNLGPLADILEFTRPSADTHEAKPEPNAKYSECQDSKLNKTLDSTLLAENPTVLKEGRENKNGK